MISKVAGLRVHLQLRHAERILRREAPYAWRALELSREQGGISHLRQSMRLLELSRILPALHPKTVLELGGGTTTPVFAHHVEPVGGNEAGVTSLEESGHWEGITRTLLPRELANRVNFCHRPRLIEQWDGIRVARYDLEYDREYDLVYVDGPSAIDPSNRKPGHKLPCVDVICLVRAGFPPRLIVVDMRRHSVAFFRRWGLERQYRMRLGSELLGVAGKLLRPFRYHTVFERRQVPA